MITDSLYLLLLEDEVAHVQAIRRALATAEFPIEIRVASSLRDYTEQVKVRVPSIVVMDLTLPDGSPQDSLNLLLQKTKFPVLVMTSSGNEAMAVAAMKAGALDYLVKSPEVFADMPRYVQRAMREWKLIEAQKRTAVELQIFRAGVEQSANSIVIAEANGSIAYVNPAFEKTSGYSASELMGKNVSCLRSREHADRADRNLWDTITAKKSWQGVFHNQRKDGSLYWEASTISPILDSSGEITRYIGINENITDRRDMEERVRESLREKEVLLKEIHHRVQNNLQIVSSLLRLQSSRIENSVAKEALQDMQNRVRSMALIHEHLYRSDNLARVDMAAYLKTLCQQVFRAMVATNREITIQMHLDSLFLEMDQAIPFGLLVNELVSNAFKHAFPAGGKGQVVVDFHLMPEREEWRLRVADNGIGLPADFDISKNTSLGLQLVVDLTRQIGGQLAIVVAPSAIFEVTFAEKKTNM